MHDIMIFAWTLNTGITPHKPHCMLDLIARRIRARRNRECARIHEENTRKNADSARFGQEEDRTSCKDQVGDRVWLHIPFFEIKQDRL